MRHTKGSVAALCVGLVLTTAPALHAQAAISNGTIRMGINKEGHLNFYAPGNGLQDKLGLTYAPLNLESTADGCLCEGWGVGVSGGKYDFAQGGASVDNGGIENLLLESFAFDSNSATSVVKLQWGGTDLLRITHAYAPSPVTPYLYEVVVTIENISGEDLGTGSDGLRYRRLMDWDIEPTPFSEYVTLHGNGAANLLGTSDDGFQSTDPFSSRGGICAPLNTDFANNGPCDHGALFDFGFDALLAGTSRTFTTFYGAAGSQKDILAALSLVGAEVYSLGKNDRDPIGGTPATFAFGFKGVGGTPIPPTTTTPEPVSMALLGSGLAGVAAMRRRRQAQKD